MPPESRVAVCLRGKPSARFMTSCGQRLRESPSWIGFARAGNWISWRSALRSPVGWADLARRTIAPRTCSSTPSQRRGPGGESRHFLSCGTPGAMWEWPWRRRRRRSCAACEKKNCAALPSAPRMAPPRFATPCASGYLRWWSPHATSRPAMLRGMAALTAGSRRSRLQPAERATRVRRLRNHLRLLAIRWRGRWPLSGRSISDSNRSGSRTTISNSVATR